jgi:hypothetical protein
VQYGSLGKLAIHHPKLLRKHNYGRKLADGIRRAPVTNLEPKVWYKLVGSGKFDLEKFFDSRSSKDGRYSRKEQTGFYVADTPKTAVVEMLKEKRLEPSRPMWLAKVSFRECLDVIDLTIPFPGDALRYALAIHGLVHSGEFRHKRAESDTGDSTYCLTQFIGDLVRERGLDGILYTSAWEYPFRTDAWGTCLVIFDPDLRNLVDPPPHQSVRWEKCTVDPPFNLPDMELVPVVNPQLTLNCGEATSTRRQCEERRPWTS